MKLFLASYRFGAHVDEFRALTSGPGRVAVISHATDGWPEQARESALTSEIRGLRDLGYDPYELDVRRFRDRPDALAAELDSVQTLWIRGGNTFVLRSVLHQCGADEPIVSRVRDGRLVYAGYSAGACVASPSLRGVDQADDPAEIADGAVVWEGLGLVDFALVPHFGSVLDENGAGAAMVAKFEREGVRHLTLTDEQVVVVNGDRTERI
ncbi:MAG: Type 1 glutamine amidotransferase-like domain-containing protein [Rhodococcus sp. (in: high G+C Gram-positive bacteria)]